jgi:hypothetical protein
MKMEIKDTNCQFKRSLRRHANVILFLPDDSSYKEMYRVPVWDL